MSGFYKKKHAATARFWQENGFYLLLAATLILLCIFAWILSAGEKQEEPQQDLNAEQILPQNLPEPLLPTVLPDPTKADTTQVNTEVPDIEADPNETTESQLTEELTETVQQKAETVTEPVTLLIPVATETVHPYSGADPVFSETMRDWRTHDGIDYLTSGEDPVLAAADGIVEDVYTDELMGVTVVIRHHDDSRTIYQSLAINPRVLKGTAVTQGDMIGRTGNTADNESLDGNHLHFALLVDGGYADPATRFSND